jgi:hypothetical protein
MISWKPGWWGKRIAYWFTYKFSNLSGKPPRLPAQSQHRPPVAAKLPFSATERPLFATNPFGPHPSPIRPLPGGVRRCVLAVGGKPATFEKVDGRNGLPPFWSAILPVRTA